MVANRSSAASASATSSWRTACWPDACLPRPGRPYSRARRRSSATISSACTEDRGRNRSPQYRMMPLMIRKTPATTGLPKISRNGCVRDQADQADRDGGQNDHPGQPLVPAVSTRRSRMELTKPPMIRIQSRQK